MLSKTKKYIRRGLKIPLIEESFSRLSQLDDKLTGFESSRHSSQERLDRQLEQLRMSIGRIEARQLTQLKSKQLQDYEFKVFSQWGEDGIIQFLTNAIPGLKKTFIEFGVEDYSESNTRFLLINNNWSGLVIDGSEDNVNRIRGSEYYWRFDLKAVCAFVDKDNINKLIGDAGYKGEVGILSIDIDGNDYWVWQAIDVVNPQIVIAEYNHRFGYQKAVTVPYKKNFDRRKAHYSMLYAGASLKAMVELAKSKGYFFVGTSSGGNNAFFVRNELKNDKLPNPSITEGFTAGKFREARDKTGNLSYISADEERDILKGLTLIEVGGASSSGVKH